MNLLKSLQSLLAGKKKRHGQPIVRAPKWYRLHIEELERRDLPSLTPSGLIAAVDGYDMPTFSWSAVAAANHYELKVVDKNTGQAPIVVPNFNGTSYTATTAQALTPGHSFTTDLFAFNTNGQYSLITQTFSLAALAAPTILSPSATVPASSGYDTPTFTWSAVAGVNHYYLKVVDNNTGQTPIVVPDVSGTSYTATIAQVLTPGHRFTAYVYAFSTNNQAYSLSKQTFSLAALASPTSLTPIATVPASSNYDTPNFTWNAVVGANHYYLKVVDNNTGRAPIVIPDVSGTSYTATIFQALTPGHSFTTYVYAFSTNSQTYSFSTQKIALAALAAPSLTSGPSGTIPPSSGYDTPTFTWGNVSGANDYCLMLVDNTTGAVVVNNPNVSTNSFTPTAPLTPGHSYTWRVAAKSENGQSDFSSQTFNLAALAAPSQTGPTGAISTTSPSFAWNSVTGANLYRLSLVDTTTNVVVIHNSNVSTNSFTPTAPLTPGNSYTWYVAAVSSNGQNTLSFSSQTFTLAAATIAAPSLASGPSGTISTTSPSFAWNNVGGANLYHLYLVDTTAHVVVFNNPNVSSNSFTPTAPLTPGHSYTWYVAAVSSIGQGAFSNQTFNLAALAAPPLTSGLSGTIAPSTGYETPTFAWSAVPLADHYALNVVDNNTGALAIYAPNLSGTSYTATAAHALTPGHSFTTYVYAFTANNQAYTLSKQTFALAALAAPTNLTPSATLLPSPGYNMPTFTWSAVAGANHYYLKVVDNNTGRAPIVVPDVSGTSYTTTAIQALTPGHSFTTYVYAFTTSNQSSNPSTQIFMLNMAPTASLTAPSLVNEGSVATVALTNPYDLWSADTVAGFHYAFALDGASLAGVTYANAGTSPSQNYTFTDGLSSHSVTVRILAQDGEFTDYIATIQVNSVTPTAILTVPATVNEGSAFMAAMSNPFDPSSPATAAGFHYAFALDGASLAGVTYASASATPSQSFTFTDGLSTHSVTVRIFANDGTFTDYTATMQVNSVAPTATLTGPAAVNEGSPFTVGLVNPFDPSSLATAMGFHYAFALDGASLAGATYANASINPSQSLTFNDGLSTHSVTVRIFADDGSFTDYTATIQVNYVPPTVNIGGTSTGVSGAAIAFTGSGTDPSAPDTAAGFQYLWNFGDGSTSTLQSPSHTYAHAGNYTATLTASDTDGGDSSATTTVLVTSIIDNSSPNGFSNSGPWGFEFNQGYNGNDDYTSAGTGAAVASWTFSGLTPGLYEVSATWTPSGNRADNAPYTVLNGSALIGSILVNQKLAPAGFTDGSGRGWQQLGGPYAITGTTLTVNLSNDADNYVIADAIRIERLVGVTTATIVGVPSSGHGPEWTPNILTAQFPGGATGSDQYSWTVTKNGSAVATGCSAALSFTPATAGIYQIAVNVINSQGDIASATATLVADVAPLTVALNDPSSVTVGSTLTATAVLSDPNATGLSYSWNFGDGATAATTTPTANHVYAATGTYAVRVTATDSEGGQGTATANVVVSPPPLSVTLGITSNALMGSPTAFSASVLNQQSGTTLTFNWSFGDGATDTTTTPTDSHIYTAVGIYTAAVTVTDSQGDQGSASVSVVVTLPTLLAVTLDGTSFALVGSSATFSLSNPNQPPAGGFTYSWNFGDGATATTTVPTASHAYGTVGTYTASVTVTDTQGDHAYSSAPITVDPTSDSSDPLFKPVVNQSSFTYLGSFALPHSANGTDTAYSYGGLTYRYVNGNLQFFTTNTVNSGGLVYEFNYPGISTNQSNLPQAQVVTNWGDIYTGQKLDDNSGGVTTLSSGDPTYGLYYDQSSNRLYWNYGDWYNASFPYQQSFGYSTLNDTTGVATGAGAWSLTNRPEKFDRGGMLQIPSWFANAYTNGDTLGIGFGGYFSITASASFGPALAAIAPPNPALNPDDSSLANIPLIGYPAGAPDIAHRDTDYTSYYNGGTYPTTPGQWNAANGTGYWTWSDSIFDGGTWIDTPTMQGVLFIAKVGQGNVYYQSSDRHAQSGSYEWMVYNPADLAAVASGAKQQWQIQPEYEWTTPTLPFGYFDQLNGNSYAGDGVNNLGGVVFDPTTNRLYVLQENTAGENGSEAWPEMYVYQVGAPPTATTPGNPEVVGTNQQGFSMTGAGWMALQNGYLGEQMQLNAAASATASWQESDLASGNYMLSVDWNAQPNLNSSAAVYQIYDGSTLIQTVTVNQSVTPSGQIVGGSIFQSLGTFNIASGDLTVVVSNQGSGDLAADALQIKPM